jgi:hypothetical protein
MIMRDTIFKSKVNIVVDRNGRDDNINRMLIRGPRAVHNVLNLNNDPTNYLRLTTVQWKAPKYLRPLSPTQIFHAISYTCS